MKRRSIVALCLVAVVAAAVTAATSGATKKATASSITVWLQVDAQSGWPDVVAAANQKFQSDHPGTTVNVQYQNWGDHLQKFDATLAGGGGPDVIEMGNTEMTKYMAAGAFAPLDKSSFDNSASWLKGLAASGAFGGKTYGVPYYAGSRVVTYRTDLFKKAGHLEAAGDDGRSTWRTRRSCSRRTRRRASRRSTSRAPTGTSRWASSSTTAEGSPSRSAASGRACSLEEVDRRPDRLQELLPRDLAGVEDDRRDASEPVRRVRTGPGGVDDRPELVHLLRREGLHGRDRAVRDAGPREGPGDPGLPRRLRPRSPGESGSKSLAADWIKDFTGTSSEKTLQAKGNIPNATNLLGSSVNERAAARSWFVPTAKHWVDVENGNILRNMLAQILTNKLTIKQAASSASDNIASVLNQP